MRDNNKNCSHREMGRHTQRGGFVKHPSCKELDSVRQGVLKGKAMSFERIAGLLFSGFMAKLYALGFAIWIAYEAATFIRHAFASVSMGFAS